MREAARLTRRRFLTVTGAAAALAFSVNLPSAHAAEARAADLSGDPFTLGVASGDPAPNGVVLWTRLAPAPFEPAGGMPNGRVSVRWEVATDERFDRVLRRGYTWADPAFNHAVHVEVNGLAPDRVYWYRFRVGRWTSPAGRTRTVPAPGAPVTDMRLGVLSCQAYHDGYFTALRHLADEDLDAVFHTGDYLYEYAVNAAGGARGYTGDQSLPAVFNTETITLEDYRLRYALYKSDPDLQAAHAAFPWLVTWDDHETENNYADDIPENDVPPEEFLIRRAAAYRAYWENMPLRAPQRPTGPDMRLYRRFSYGKLAQFDILDTRQYRSNQANGDGWKVPGDESRDPSRTMLGATQERWLLDGLRSSGATWNVIPQQVVFSQRLENSARPARVSMDAWDGYPAARERVLAGIDAAGAENVVVLTGDVHVHYAFDIKRDFADPASRTVGVELVGTSTTSGKDGAAVPANHGALTGANPHLKFYNGQRGYVAVTLGTGQLRADYKVVSAVTHRGGTLSTAASFVSEAGDPGLKPA
ncbi:alkaline phosphatase D family protein [Streptomyces capparidis]